MKNKFIKSTIILLIGGLITKILGMVIKIVLTRTVSVKGIGLYMLVLPTFNLFITLCTLGLPSAISKLISERKRNNKKLILSIIPVSLFFNLLLMVVLFLISPYISKYLLNNPDTYYPIVAITLTLPFICLSSILKGYFFGKERMLPNVISNIGEQLIRLFLILFYIPNLLKYNLNIAITGVVLINIVSEFVSILILLLFTPKNIIIKKDDFEYDRTTVKDVLNISIPVTSSRLIGSISYFLEPIILTFVLIKVGYNNDFIIYEYGIINGYVYPLLLLPSFFTLAISNSILPVISYSYSKKKYEYTKRRIRDAVKLSLVVGIPMTLIFILVPDIPLKLVYNTNLGLNYIKVIAPFFLLHYIQAPLTSALQALNEAKEAMKGTFYGAIIRTILLFVLSYFKIGLWSLVIASISNIVFVTVHHILKIKKIERSF